MNLQALSNTELCQRMEHLVRSERKITHLVLVHILEIETRKIYADLGYDGMYSYMTQKLGYSESSAYRRLQSARLLRQVPALTEKIESGSLNLSQTTKLQKCLKDQEKQGERISDKAVQQLLEKLENKNSFETEKLLAIEFNKPAQLHESLKPQRDDSIRLEITLSKDQFAELQKSKNFLSHICTDGSWADVITNLAAKYNHAKLGKKSSQANPLAQNFCVTQLCEQPKTTTQGFAATQFCDQHEVATKSFYVTQSPLNDQSVNTMKLESESKKMNSNSKCFTAKKTPQRSYISIKTRRALLDKTNHCCQYRDAKTGKYCHSKYQLEIDHIKPIAMFGEGSMNNLRVLCRTHNALMAKRSGLLRP